MVASFTRIAKIKGFKKLTLSDYGSQMCLALYNERILDTVLLKNSNVLLNTVAPRLSYCFLKVLLGRKTAFF